MAAMQLTRTHRILLGLVVSGTMIIAAIGFAGSYTAVRELAEQKGFGDFSLVFPIGIDAGICVLLALDLLLTWLHIPFPLLRQTAWLLTAATIAFNGAAAWPDPLGVGMHASIPVLFIVAVEAARHAVGRIADITADKHMEGVRLTRWLLSPFPTFKLWRRMKLWELRSYDQAIKLEQDRLIYQARLHSRYGRAWRRQAPAEALMPLRLAKYGVPLAETAPAGLTAAGVDPALLPPGPKPSQSELPRVDEPEKPKDRVGGEEPKDRGELEGPKVQAEPAEPKVHAGREKLKVHAGLAEPKDLAGPEQPKGLAEPEEPTVHTGPDEPKAQARPAEPKVYTGPTEAKDPAEPEESKEHAEPEEPVHRADPEEPPVSPQREEPQVAAEPEDESVPHPGPFPGIEAHRLPASPPLPPEVSGDVPSEQAGLTGRELTTA
ncbi:DUF2637 domain-containing protein, partial [Streptomyces sp. H27-C3]|uniref:DUF2637 domain-containing protein n=1 Tax=Streptomyces sp. H27-C3 TaxID=3046305 RepID=UPI0024B969CE